MGPKRNKKVSAQHVGSGKGAKPFVSSASVLPNAETSGNRICWRFCHVDHDSPWAFDKMDAPTLIWLMGRLSNFESMTVNEMFNNGEEPGKHYDVAALPTRRSRDRLEEMGLGDMTRISRLRLGGKPRLYGFLVANVFHVVWWDPEHEIWPSAKNHT